MQKDLIIICFAVMAIMAGSFVGASVAVYDIKRDIAVEMSVLRSQVEPVSCKLFSGSYQP